MGIPSHDDLHADADPLRAENRSLRARLQEAEDTLTAIRSGHVEALVVQTADGPKLFGLTSADAASNQLRGEMLAQINEAVVAVDDDQRVTYFNAAAERHFGCSTADALGQRLGRMVQIVWGDEAAESAVRAALDAEGRWSGDVAHRLPDGRELAVEVSLSVLHDETGRRSGTLAVVRDVTQRRAAERSRSELAERLQLAMRHAALGSWTWDLRTDEVIWSPECYPIFGMPPGDRRTAASVTAAYVHADDRERVVEQRRAAIDQRALYECEYRIVRGSDGAVRWVASMGRASYDDRGQATLMIGTLADITGRKLAEEALREDARRKDEFIAMLAHELRNPLAPIRTSVSLLAGRDTDPLVARCTGIIDRQTAQMARLLDDLLDVSRLSRGQVVLQLASVTLGEVIDMAVETSRPLMDQRSQHLVVAASDAARALVLHADVARLVQVLSNLLNNAAKYSHHAGRIELHAEPDGGDAVVRVRDEGIGIELETLSRMFGLFVQGGEARRHAPGGLGIGLALAHQLVQMHGGSLTAGSPGIGCGSEFTVRLPLKAGEPPSREPAPRGDDGSAPASVRRRVLVADDNADAADTTGLLLQSQGCEVTVVYDGESAVREAARLRPHVVVLDLGMRGVDGLEACRRIRGQSGGRTLTLIALSGWGREEDRRRSLQAGFDLHLSKPVEPSELLAAVRAAHAPAH